MKKLLTLVFYFNLIFFCFDIKDVNTIDDIALIYDNDSLNDQKYYNISFYNLYLSEIDNAFKNLDIQIVSVTPEDYDKMPFTSTDNIIETIKKDLIENGYEEKAINVYKNNFKIKSMVVISTKKDMIALESRVKII